jgi:type IV pilus assembly protein PilB
MSVDVGQILLESGRIASRHLDQARDHAASHDCGIEEALLELQLVTEDDLAHALGGHFDIPGFSLARLPKPDPKVTALVPEPIARRCAVVPIEKAGDTLMLLMADPTDIRTVQAIRGQTALEVQPAVGSPATVRVALDTFYPKPKPTRQLKILPFVAKLITEEAARTYQALPIDRDGSLLTVATANADQAKIQKAIELATGLQVRVVAMPWDQLERAIERAHAQQPAKPTAAPEPADEAASAAPQPRSKPAAAPVQSLDSLLGGGLERPAAPAAPPPSAASSGSLSLDDEGSLPRRPAAAAASSGSLSLDDAAPAPSRPAPAAGPSSTGGDGLLSLELGGGSAPPPATAPKPPAAGPAKPEELSLDGMLRGEQGQPKAVPIDEKGQPAAVGGNGGKTNGVSRKELEQAAAATDAAGYEEDEQGPDLGAGGQEGGPRTGLKVDPSERERMKELVSKTWGELDPRLAKLVPEKVARNYRVVATGRHEKTLYVAMEDPDDVFAVETVEFTSGLRVKATAATPEQVEAGLEVLYVPDEDEMADLFAELEGVGLDEVLERDELDALSDLDAAAAAEAAPVVKLVNKLISDAIAGRASDIHVEVFEENMRIRYRVDGVLHEVMRLPLELRDPLTSRIKIMCRMDISERRLPQDGRLRLLKNKKPIDFRISSIPTVFGEKLVMRILDREQIQLDMTKLGFEPEPMGWFREAIHKPYGMCLVVGPSGCGKTNTLYSALADVNSPDVNIMTCEDPVEFSTTGLNQVQAQESIGLNFAAALRSFLRQDPNVILVGEVRDFETAEIAIKAALTGHMVLSTLHTNDAPACVNRLTNMGVEPFLIASSLHLVSAQRLVRVVCKECGKPADVAVEQLVQMGFAPERAKGVQPRKGGGCSSCEETGYRGRTALFEVLRITNDMREMILCNAPQTEIRELGVREGMMTLRQAGLHKVEQGITSVDEVIRETIG